MKQQTFTIIITLLLILSLPCSCNRKKVSTYRNGSNTLVINDFENKTSITGWHGTISISKEYRSHGYSSLRLSADSGASLWVETQKLPSDWSKYEFLRFDIFNPSSRLHYGNIQICDRYGTDEEAEFKGQSYSGEGKLFLNTGWNHFEFILKSAMVEEGNRHLALDGLRKMRFSFRGSDEPIFIDNIRLVKDEENSETASSIDPHDCNIVIDNRNVYASLSGPSDSIKTAPEILLLRKEAMDAKDKLEIEIRLAELQGLQTLYQRIPLITAEVGMGIRSKLVWFQNEEEEKKILTHVIISCTKTANEISELLSAGREKTVVMEPENEVGKLSLYVPPYSPLSELRVKDGVYRDKNNNPAIIFSMLQINEGPLLEYFAPFNHRIESYSVGGGSRYTIESSPVYEAFHRYPDTKRVGWDGWCGHLIKDRWAMGGKKEDVVICLESPHIREAVLKYMQQHHKEWAENPHLLYNIMAYELQYICYCDKSQQMFRDWLKSKYSDIKSLNQIWRTGFSSFNDVRAPETKNARPPDNVNRAAWYDWACFNNRRFTDYLTWIKSEMRKYDPDTPICAGGTSSMLNSSNSVTGIDEELIINEVDDVILNESGESPIFSDLLLSLSNSRKLMVDPEMGGSTHGLLLQFLHGKYDISKWWWAAYPSNEYPHMNESSLPHSKEISLSDIDEVLRIGLDVRRLASEITAFTKNPPEIAILYSKTSIIQVPPSQVQSGTTPYIDALHGAWEGARFLGCRIGFISEKQILSGGLNRTRLLIVPAVKYIPSEVVQSVKRYIEDGGTTIIIPESFVFDQYAHENNLLGEFGIMVNGVTLPPVTGKAEKIQNYDQSFSQSILYGDVREKITCRTDEFSSGDTSRFTLMSDGLVQTIDPGNNKVIGRFDNGKPAIVLIRAGKGRAYYLASPLQTSDYHLLFSPIADLPGLNRPVLAVGKNNKLITGAEVRAVERDNDYLVYASNLTGLAIEFDLKGPEDIRSVTDLRNMTESNGSHVKLRPYQETIFSIARVR